MIKTRKAYISKHPYIQWLTANTIELVVAYIPNVTYESLDTWYKTMKSSFKKSGNHNRINPKVHPFIKGGIPN